MAVQSQKFEIKKKLSKGVRSLYTQYFVPFFFCQLLLHGTVKLGDKERFDKEQIGLKKPFPVTNCQFTS